VSPEFASILLDINERSSRCPDLSICNQRHGYPLHIAVLSHKFEIALRMLDLPGFDPKVLSSIGANIVHLIFVKYDKNPELARKILVKCAQKGVEMNHIDTLKAAPIHVAIRKKQY
jgi:hypothetical protein